MELSSIPSHAPSVSPSTTPTTAPTQMPSTVPSQTPSHFPSQQPTHAPTQHTTRTPTSAPTAPPSRAPTLLPTTHMPNCTPTSRPTTQRSAGTFPTGTGLSVILPHNSHKRNISVGGLIVLPFLRVTPASNSLAQQGFYDIDLTSGTAKVGTNYVVYVNRSPNRLIDLNTLTPNEGFHLSPAVSYDYSGRSVSNAGDINGDTYDDLIVGVPYAARCYVLFGNAQGFVNMTEGFTIFGQADSMTGWSVSGAGDVNNDTFTDLIIGAPYGRDGSGACGAAYVIYGKPFGYVNIYLETELSPAQGFTIYGATQSELLGLSVSSAGDVNNDGFDDVIVGALKATSSYRGGAYVVYGANETRGKFQLNSLSETDGFSMSGPIWSYSGYSVSGAGDVNGDGFDDVLIGSVPFRTTFGVQTTYLIYGNNETASSTISLSGLVKQQGVALSGGGVVVSGVGDINHDGHDDIMIGSNYGFSGGGIVTVSYTDTYVSPAMLPTPSPTVKVTVLPSVRPTWTPTTRIPTRVPTPQPSTQPTVQQSGPSEPPTEAHTGPTFTPSSVPSISTEHPTSCPTTSFPSSRPSTQPTSKPSAQPNERTRFPTEFPTTRPTESMKPSVAIFKPSFRSRNPVFRVPSSAPTFRQPAVDFFISKGGSYEAFNWRRTNYTVNTNNVVFITGAGYSGGNIYTVLPQVNGSLHIEIFNNISDKLNLTSHSTINSMSDLVITSGSVIITFPTSAQRVRLVNITPLDISENNFIFAEGKFVSPPMERARVGVIVLISYIVAGSVVLYLLNHACKQYKGYKARIKHQEECIIALEDNPTQLFVDYHTEISKRDRKTLNENINMKLFWLKNSDISIDCNSFDDSKNSIDNNSIDNSSNNNSNRYDNGSDYSKSDENMDDDDVRTNRQFLSSDSITASNYNFSISSSNSIFSSNSIHNENCDDSHNNISINNSIEDGDNSSLSDFIISDDNDNNYSGHSYISNNCDSNNNSDNSDNNYFNNISNINSNNSVRSMYLSTEKRDMFIFGDLSEV